MIRSALRWVSLASTLALTSYSEWSAGVAAGLDPRLAVLIPLSIDAYVMTALLSGRDVVPSLGLLEVAVVVGTVHSSWTDLTKLTLGAGLGTALTLVLWRIDTLFHQDAEEAARVQREAEAARVRAQKEEEAARVRAAQEAAVAAAQVQPPAMPMPASEPDRPERHKASEKKTTKTAKVPAPSRERALSILYSLDSFDQKSNGQLAREYGGSDRFWSNMKQLARDGLATLSGEASRL